MYVIGGFNYLINKYLKCDLIIGKKLVYKFYVVTIVVTLTFALLKSGRKKNVHLTFYIYIYIYKSLIGPHILGHFSSSGC